MADSAQELRQETLDHGVRERAALVLLQELVQVLVHWLHRNVKFPRARVDEKIEDLQEVGVGRNSQDEPDLVDAEVVHGRLQAVLHDFDRHEPVGVRPHGCVLAERLHKRAFLVRSDGKKGAHFSAILGQEGGAKTAHTEPRNDVVQLGERVKLQRVD